MPDRHSLDAKEMDTSTSVSSTSEKHQNEVTVTQQEAPEPTTTNGTTLEKPVPKDVEPTQVEQTPGSPELFKPDWRFQILFTSISAITLMVALDTTSLGNALPVRRAKSKFQSFVER
jgi:hypothetical protein